MILKLEINTQTKSGRKAYEFIESLEDKEGITYTDYTGDYFMTEEECEILGKEQ